jgi:predicted acylesterase/phospholipase RssA
VPEPELRIALVLNGGVSLAVWISGVVHELDRLRRREPPYDTWLGEQDARVDVIAGASAGGINGALLAAAIQGDKPLRGPGDQPLRETWLQIGDLGALTRSAREPDPPSLLRGDEYFLEPLEKVLAGLLVKDNVPSHPLYLYMTTTALRTRRYACFATDSGTITEPDHRVVLRFSAGPPDQIDAVPEPPAGDEMATDLPLDATQVRRLARAARSSSSFPGAFPPHVARFRETDDTAQTPTYLVDGGILDNQPFNPVLDRLTVMPADRPVRRVLLYVVPYVTEEVEASRIEQPPGMGEVIGSSKLARDLPKLTSLERVEAMRQAAAAAHHATDVLLGDAYRTAAGTAAAALFAAYREVQAAELVQTGESWAGSSAAPGTGPNGGDPTHASREVRMPVRSGVDPADLAPLLPAATWDAARSAWRGEDGDGPWCWGLSKAERFAHAAEAFVRTSDTPRANAVRRAAWPLMRAVREAMKARRAKFATGCGSMPLRLQASWAALPENLISDVEAALDKLLDALRPVLRVQTRAAAFERLAAAEVVTLVTGTTAPAPPPAFEFFRISALSEQPVLGHDARKPEEKLAGMDLDHFAAFLKQSWRANDWMWGRLDGLTWLHRILHSGELDPAQQAALEAAQRAIAWEELPEIARAVDADERRRFSVNCDLSNWRRAQRTVLDAMTGDPPVDAGTIEKLTSAFQACKLEKGRLADEAGSGAGVEAATRLAAVATRALSGTRAGIPSPARVAVGSARRATSAMYSLAVIFARAPAVGLSVVLALAALATVLAETGSGVAWLTPAIVAVALLGAWSGFSYISSPPGVGRAVVLTALLAVDVVFAAHQLQPGALSDWVKISGAFDVVWLLVVLAAAAGAGLLVWYLVKKSAVAARWLGFALLVVLACGLVRYAWSRLTHLSDGKLPAWQSWFAHHDAVAVGLVTLVVASLALPLTELVVRGVRSD